MARVNIQGFECGDFIGTNSVDGLTATKGASSTVEIVTAVKRSGNSSLHVIPASGQQASCAKGGTYSGAYVRFYIMVKSAPSTTARAIFGTGSGTSYQIRLNPDKTLSVFTGLTPTLVGNGTTALSDANTWYRVELRHATGTNVAILRVDGVDQGITASPSGLSASGQLGCQDTLADTYEAYFDDAVWDDATWPDSGSIILMLPSSVNAAGSWTGGAGGAIDITSVNTLPPPGLASANETNATNVESAANSATDNLDINIASYTSNGVTGTVKSVQALVRNGEDIATNTKAGALLIVSNPTQGSEDSFNFGNDAGAHGIDNSGGLWFSKLGTIQDAPSVTLSSGVVVRVGKRTATTRVVCVDFMGLYVDFVPADVTEIRPILTVIRQAINRASFY